MVGRADAEVLVIEFTDLQCPYCAQFASQTFPRLKAAYIDTGKIRYASRDLPLPMHAHAETAAVAARCAGEQGRYWEYRHAVFAAQRRLGTEPWEELARRARARHRPVRRLSSRWASAAGGAIGHAARDVQRSFLDSLVRHRSPGQRGVRRRELLGGSAVRDVCGKDRRPARPVGPEVSGGGSRRRRRQRGSRADRRASASAAARQRRRSRSPPSRAQPRSRSAAAPRGRTAARAWR